MIHKLLTVSQGVRHFYPKIIRMHINTSVKMKWKLHWGGNEKRKMTYSVINVNPLLDTFN